ncbi:hypothetical protein GCM10010468_47110 [Actinocorallia longicatena]|uniref:Parallel beta helix pectate lyase-like protein n=1 Tax=Actinocorallia longicatena TaxID=111803 RepID=A0ABP6QDB2_9ACTN
MMRLRLSEVTSSLTAVVLVVSAAVGAAPAGAAACPGPSVFRVLNTDDSGPDSLRRAILDANANSLAPAVCPADAIEFDLPTTGPLGPGPFSITLESDLPEITDPVNVRGYTQPGAAAATATSPAWIQIWIHASDATNGLVVNTYGSSISGLLIGKAGDDGIKVIGDGNRVRGNYIGTHQPITSPTNPLPAPSFVQGTSGDGIDVTGDGNEIGSEIAQDRNVIAGSGLLSGDKAYGVKIAGSDNQVQGDIIGTDPTGSEKSSGHRGGGVNVVSGEKNRIGGSLEGAGNLISSNGGPAILLQGSATRTVVLGNKIGAGSTGSDDFGNTKGVVIEAGSTGNAIGSTADLGGNQIANTVTGPGVDLAGDGNLVTHNTIGTDAGQTIPLENFGGVHVTGSLNIVGGDAEHAGNVISGNRFYGISIDDESDPRKGVGNVVWGNHIGTDATGTVDLGNAANLGVGGDGVQILGGDATQVGGAGRAGFRPNVIADNDGAGVAVDSGVLNAVVRNSIHDNGGLGIDLSRDGAVLPNDDHDSDAGPNGLQNYPLVTGITNSLGVSSVGWDTASFREDPSASETTEIDFFASDTCDPSGNGEGQTLIGTALLGAGTLPGTGSTIMTQRVKPGHYVTLTATSGNGVPRVAGRTSEFSPCFKFQP